ncbi:hypothetical protein N7G274_006409 [Stereocaulon virgatum]|uniref:Uncharacterized protein n=1 Tax=Stereocaulon virgatum TaxID=373712 RepID=A0ABR4A7R4_9LECA
MSEEYESYDSSWSVYTSERAASGYASQEKPRKQGTNVHSSVAGISVHNALMNLAPPPPNALPGSKDAPWLRLTDWEMMSLRKRMKKNATWRPSESMVKLELINAGRGPHNYWETKQDAEARGLPFLDVDNIASASADKPLAWGEVSLTAPSSSEERPRNKGMVLNEAKKRKRAESAAFLAQYSSTNSRSSSSTSENPQRRKKAIPHAPRLGTSPITSDSAKNPPAQPHQSGQSKKAVSSLLPAHYERDTIAMAHGSFEDLVAKPSLSSQAQQAASSLVTTVWEGSSNQDLAGSSNGETEIGQETESKGPDFASVAMGFLEPFAPASEPSTPLDEQQARAEITVNGTTPEHATSFTNRTATGKPSTATLKPSITSQSVRQPRSPKQIATQHSPVSQPSPRVRKSLPKNRSLNGKPLFDHRHSLAKIVGKKPPVTKQPVTLVSQSLPITKPSPMARPPPTAKSSLATKSSPATKSARTLKNVSGSGKPDPKRRYVPGGPGGGGRYVNV